MSFACRHLWRACRPSTVASLPRMGRSRSPTMASRSPRCGSSRARRRRPADQVDPVGSRTRDAGGWRPVRLVESRRSRSILRDGASWLPHASSGSVARADQLDQTSECCPGLHVGEQSTRAVPLETLPFAGRCAPVVDRVQRRRAPGTSSATTAIADGAAPHRHELPSCRRDAPGRRPVDQG
jgi:hypothetical protein